MSHAFGIIGAGIMGGAVGRVLKNIPGVEIKAVCDPAAERREALGRELGVPSLYASHKDMLEKEKLDAVAVATPDDFHREPAVDALRAGCHVYVEKPMATSQADAEAMVRAVRETGKKLQVDFNHRWLSPYHKVREMIQAGKLGEPQIGFARKNNPISVPTQMIKSWSAKSTPAWFLSCHDIDLMTWWFDADPVEAYARGTKKVLAGMGFDTYDGIQSLVGYAGGKQAVYEAVWIYPNTSPYMPDSFMEIIGTAGSLHLDRKAEAIDALLQEKFDCPRTFLNYKVFEEWQGAFPAAVRAFVYAIEHDTEPHVDARAGLRSTAVLDAIHRSLASGKPEKISLNV